HLVLDVGQGGLGLDRRGGAGRRAARRRRERRDRHQQRGCPWRPPHPFALPRRYGTTFEPRYAGVTGPRRWSASLPSGPTRKDSGTPVVPSSPWEKSPLPSRSCGYVTPYLRTKLSASSLRSLESTPRVVKRWPRCAR